MHKINLILCCVLLASISIKEASSLNNIHYEKCDENRIAFTKKLLNHGQYEKSDNDVEARFCSECDPEDSSHSFFDSLAPLSLKIPEICFLASASRSVSKKVNHEPKTYKQREKESKKYYYCESPASSKNTRRFKLNNKTFLPMRPCINEEYLNMTIKSFNYISKCFNVSNDGKVELFKLFNHESSFISNNRSDTGARCYGQVTLGATQEIERRIANVETKDMSDPYNLYQKALKICPDLANQILIPKDILNKKIRGSKLKQRQRQEKENAVPTFCRSSQHPLTCFFYSFYNYMLNDLVYEDAISGTYPSRKTDQQTLKRNKDFHLPLKPLEIIVLKGVLKNKNSGREKETTIVLKDDKEVHKVMENFNYDTSKVSIRKIPVYDDLNKVKLIAKTTAYNGGVSVISKSFEAFVLNIKDQISKSSSCRSCAKNSTKSCQKGSLTQVAQCKANLITACQNSQTSRNKYCKYRKQILDGKPLSFKVFKQDYTDNLRNFYQINDTQEEIRKARSGKGKYEKKVKGIQNTAKRRRNEVANFHEKIEQDIHAISGDKNDKNLKDFYKNQENGEEIFKKMKNKINKKCNYLQEDKSPKKSLIQ
ncbi:MAG: hypothetical protein ACR2M7_05240 [Bdellovibrionales bacterium]